MVWREDGIAFPSFEIFLQRFREFFDHPKEGKSAGDRLLELSQGKRTVAEYALSFRTLAAQSSWLSDTLKVLFRRGLNHELQSELACRDEGRDLDQFIELAIKIDNLIRSVPVSTVTDETEPTQVNSYHLLYQLKKEIIALLNVYVCTVVNLVT